jgi:hypothetical protein
MPFLQVDETEDPPGKIGSALPPAILVVQPDQVLRLKHRLEARREKVLDFIRVETDKLTNVPPPGADPCSARVAGALGQNGQAAVDAMSGFVDELTRLIDSLDEAVRLYRLVEESNTNTLGREPG